MTAPDAARPVRGTQLLVEHMGGVFHRRSLLAIEVGWRWFFGIPFLLVCWQQGQQIVAAYPLESSGFNSIDTQNPWVGAVQISNVISFYEPHALLVLRWLLPVAAIVWIALSGLGRGLLLQRLDARMRFRPFTLMVTQGAWLGLFALIVWGWLRAMGWDAATHIDIAGEPDLVGYFIWAIFLSLGFFTVFALTSWPLSVVPLLVQRENRSLASAFRESLRLGKPLTEKLVEINLVLGIVKLALIVLAMVFSAAPVPFSDELGSGVLKIFSAASLFLYFVANDFFQVVRLQAFLAFWRKLRQESEP